MPNIPQNAPRFNSQGQKSTPIYAGNRVIGHVTGDTFHKSILGSKHILRTPRAICFDRSTLYDAAQAGATCAVIVDRERGTVYTATFATIRAYSFPVLRGYGDQVGVPLDHWSINGATPVAEGRAAATNGARKDLQLTLFGEVGQ
jgi:hypothetical protein